MPDPTPDTLEATRTLLRAMQTRLARRLAAGESVAKGDARELVGLTERVERMRPHVPTDSLLPPHVSNGDAPKRRCGAELRSGATCGRWPMRGMQRCDMHGGKSPKAKEGLERREVEKAIRATLGIPLEIPPAEAILRCVYEAAGNVEMLRAQVQVPGATDPWYDYTGKPQTSLVLNYYNEERDRLARFAKLAADMRIDEVRVRLAQAQGQALAEIVLAAVDACDPTPDERQSAINAADRMLRAYGAKTGIAA